MTSPLVPDYKDLSDQEVLPSFPSIRKKTLSLLYGDATATGDLNISIHHNAAFVDKSPKGSVDWPIQDLVDLINQHPSFATLSSCSGRISLFDPQGNNNDNDSAVDVGATDPSAATTAEIDGQARSSPASGKGGTGAWLFVSHEEIEPIQVLSLFFHNLGQQQQHEDVMGIEGERSSDQHHHQSSATNFWTFKFEPLLLHVAASNLERGQQLLQIALQAGFRESGLIVTPARVTVAIRSYSLALAVPLSKSGSFRPTEPYLEALVDESNTRLRRNWSNMLKLSTSIERSIFRPRDYTHARIRARPLPALNLWGHAACAVPRGSSSTSGGDADIVVMGGYGRGPALDSFEVSQDPPHHHSMKACQRSDAVYRLRREQGAWSQVWEKLVLLAAPDKPVIEENCFGLGVRKTSFASREGADACLLVPPPTLSSDNSSHIVAVFGGRKGPAHPLGELLLYEYPGRPMIFQTPVDVRGSIPEPRWGHTFTSLQRSSSHPEHIALLVGGRNEKTAFRSIHVLSMVESDSGTSRTRHMLWEKVVLPCPMKSIFNHDTVSIDDQVIVFGGLTDPDDLLEQILECSDPQSPIAFSLSSPLETLASVHHEGLVSKIGQASCLLHQVGGGTGSKGRNAQQRILLSGGVAASPDEQDDDDPLQCITLTKDGHDEWTAHPLHLMIDSPDEVDFGSMVHHRCLQLPATVPGGGSGDEIALVGGGVAGFAFSQCFANSYHLTVNVWTDGDETGDSSTTRLDAAEDFRRQAPPPFDTADTSAPPVTAVRRRANHDQLPQETDVLYVVKSNAKTLKTMLEEASLLDKSYRMTGAEADANVDDPDSCIAVPVVPECLSLLEESDTSSLATAETTTSSAVPRDWTQLVVGIGRQTVPNSTSSYAAVRRSRTRQRFAE